MTFYEKSAVILATGGGVGNIPVAPGTFGSLLGLPLCFLLGTMTAGWAAAVTVAFILFSVGVSHLAEIALQKHDPGAIVIDEAAGMMVTLLALPLNAVTVVAGFVIFRLLDITKPFPIRRFERMFPGGAGVVADDVAAGVAANLILRLGLRLLA
jgi:phosphatidylglycerophosphatase A